MENVNIKKEPIDNLLSIIDVKEEKIDEIDQSNNTEIASKNSEEQINSFEVKKETKDPIDHSKVKEKRGKGRKYEMSCEICN